MAAEVLAAAGLMLHRGHRCVLREVDVVCRAGEVTVLLGANGAGKSTLLAALAGDLRPSDGTIRLNGRPLDALTGPQLALRRAVMGQQLAAGWGLTAREVVGLGRLPHGGAATDALCLEALHRVGLADHAQRPVARLSGGEQQRVHLARVLVQVWAARGPDGPTAILLDEPTASQDLACQHMVLRLARDAAREGRAVVAVLHDPNLAARYADAVVLLAGGGVVAQGRTAVALTPAHLARTYGVAVAAHTTGEHTWFAVTG